MRMDKLKNWCRKTEYIYINQSRTFYIEKVQWFMMFPQIMIFYNYDKNKFESIAFEWLFWSVSFGDWE